MDTKKSIQSDDSQALNESQGQVNEFTSPAKLQKTEERLIPAPKEKKPAPSKKAQQKSISKIAA